MESKQIIKLIWLILLFGMFQGCAGPGQMNRSDSWKSYNQDYEKMKSVVEQAIKSFSLGINFVDENSSKNRTTIIFSRLRSLGNQQVQKNQGTVIIRKVAEGKSKIKIDNPEYHYSVPRHNREDYRRQLFARINDILN